MSVSDFAFFGRLHPLLLHLPIGLLLGALVLEVLAARHRVTRPALGLYLWLAALAAAVSAAAGWVLAHEDGYGGETLELHERLGIALAIAAVLAALLHDPRGISRPRLWLYRLALVAACGLLVPAGHLGSKLTHGEDWLEGPRERRETSVAKEPPAASGELAPGTGADEGREPGADQASPAQPDAYATVIAPLFRER